jgi:hypothetical protein
MRSGFYNRSLVSSTLKQHANTVVLSELDGAAIEKIIADNNSKLNHVR